MGEERNGQRSGANSFAWPVPPVTANPLFGLVTDFHGKLLESVAGAHRDWAEFVHRRVLEDVAVSRRLAKCQSLADMQQVYSQYLQTALEHCRTQSERGVERGKSMTDAVVQSMEPRARETSHELQQSAR